MALAKAASEINLGDIISKTEKQLTMFDCKAKNCRLLPSCSLNHVLYKAQQRFFEELQQYTLADLVGDKETWNLLVQVDGPV